MIISVVFQFKLCYTDFMPAQCPVHLENFYRYAHYPVSDITACINKTIAAQKGFFMYDNNPYGNNPYHDHNSYNNNNSQNPNPRRYPANISGDRLALAAMVLGILALASFISMTIYPPFIFGSIAIVLALLSKGRAPRMTAKARAGVICAAIGLAANCALCSTTLYMLYTKPDIMQQVNDVFESQYGMSYTEMIESILNDGTTSIP